MAALSSRRNFNGQFVNNAKHKSRNRGDDKGGAGQEGKEGHNRGSRKSASLSPLNFLVTNDLVRLQPNGLFRGKIATHSLSLSLSLYLALPFSLEME